MQPFQQAETFFKKLIVLFTQAHLPFMIGGTYAFSKYTHIQRPTKDFDFFTTYVSYPFLLKVAKHAGYTTEIKDEKWLAKIHCGKFTADVIFAERNNVRKIDESWLQRGKSATVLSYPVLLMSVEDMIRTKSYIQFRERYDGADVVHLILCQGKTLDWEYLYSTMQNDWELLLSYFFLFCFVYPSHRSTIPQHLFTKLLDLAQTTYTQNPPTDQLTRGLLLSSQYSVAIEKWGFKEI